MASQMTIGKKLFGSFGASLLLTLIVGGTSMWLISSLGTSLNKTANDTAKKQLLASEIDTNESDMVAAERGILLRTLTREPALVAQYNQDFQDATSLMKTNLDVLTPLIETETGRKIAAAIEADRGTAVQLHQQFLQLVSTGKDTEDDQQRM